MDFSLLPAAMSALSMAKALGTAAVGIRDFNEMASAISGLNDQLLKAQDALFSHNAQLLALQHQQFETTQELSKLKEALAQKGRYTLIELSKGIFVYQANAVPVNSHVGDPVAAEPLHYVCQYCFDLGIKVILKRHESVQGVSHRCSGCKEFFLESRKPAQPRSVAGSHVGWTLP